MSHEVCLCVRKVLKKRHALSLYFYKFCKIYNKFIMVLLCLEPICKYSWIFDFSSFSALKKKSNLSFPSHFAIIILGIIIITTAYITLNTKYCFIARNIAIVNLWKKVTLAFLSYNCHLFLDSWVMPTLAWRRFLLISTPD